MSMREAHRRLRENAKGRGYTAPSAAAAPPPAAHPAPRQKAKAPASRLKVSFTGRSSSSGGTTASGLVDKCWNCGKFGHKQAQCPFPKREGAPRVNQSRVCELEPCRSSEPHVPTGRGSTRVCENTGITTVQPCVPVGATEESSMSLRWTSTPAIRGSRLSFTTEKCVLCWNSRVQSEYDVL